MIFAIDIGNTNIVFGGIDEKKTYFTERVSTDINKTELEYAVIFKNLLEFRGIDMEDIEGCIISSVVPPASVTVKAAAQRVLHKTPLVVGPGVKTGLNILIDNPATLGADMVVGAVAAIRLYQSGENPKPMILFDMGTATTISVINKKGGFLGGMITPGPRVAMESLSSGTAQLPMISLTAPKKVIGTNTIDCMRSGIVYGNAAMAEGLIRRIEEELGEETLVVATGGLARFILPYCNREIIYDDDLLLKGLLFIYRKNS
jgi:type III pantothenate kinase